jgi:predicted signal transduction protein with EAL and GGDEF domain
VGRRLRESLRAGEVLARFGGDEYAVLLENTTDTNARRCAERLLTALHDPYLIGSEEVVVGGSIGVATGVGTTSPTELLRNADTAMYRAKNAGGGQIVAFEESMHTVLVHRRSIESELLRAVDDNGLRVVFQPIVGLRDRRLIAAETLVRWDHPTRGPVAPTEFIPLAEETGLIVRLGRQVLQAACGQAAAWSEVVDGGRGPSVSVNVSARQLHDPGFLADVRQVLTDTRLDPDQLILEVTESTMVSDLDAVLELMLRLRELGVRLAIDDFRYRLLVAVVPADVPGRDPQNRPLVRGRDHGAVAGSGLCPGDRAVGPRALDDRGGRGRGDRGPGQGAARGGLRRRAGVPARPAHVIGRDRELRGAPPPPVPESILRR